MPKVEELELQPRNVPQRPLKREGVQRKRRAPASDVPCAMQSLRLLKQKEKWGGGSISSLSFLSTISIYPHCLSLHHHLHPQLLRHFGRSVQVQKTPLRPDCFLCHILCLVSAVIYGLTGSSVHVCVCVRVCNYMVIVKT